MQYKWVALSVTTVGTLMSGIDSRIVLVGLPTIATQLGTDVQSAIWISQAYLLAATLGFLIVGRLTDLFGRVRLYNIGFAVFTIGSGFASVSFNSWELILARIVQGIGAAMLVANSTAILADAAPPSELGLIIGLNQIAFTVGAVFGFTASGVIIALAGWRALFYINIPIGIVATVWAHYRLKEIYTKDIVRKMDWLGFFLFTIGLTAILIAITIMSYGVSDLELGVGLMLVGIALIALFVRVETRKKAPILDPKLFKIRAFAGGTIAQLINVIPSAGALVMLTFYFQLALGMSPFQAGLAFVPLETAFMILGPLSGRLSDKFGARIPTTIGLSICSLGFLGLLLTINSTNYVVIVIPLILLGGAQGIFSSANQSSIMGSVPPNRRGVAAGFSRTVFSSGLTASAAIVTLLISLSIPYNEFSSLLNSTISAASLTEAKLLFINGYEATVIIFGIINAIAIIPSLMRGGKLSQTETLRSKDDLPNNLD